MANDQGWETYSKLVLQQLETLNKGIEVLQVEPPTRIRETACDTSSENRGYRSVFRCLRYTLCQQQKQARRDHASCTSFESSDSGDMSLYTWGGSR